MIRIAFLSDIHGNSIALEAVLADISNPSPPDLRACYVILAADESGYSVRHQRVDYDREAVIEVVKQVRYPNGQFLIDGLRGHHKPHWRSPSMTG